MFQNDVRCPFSPHKDQRPASTNCSVSDMAEGSGGRGSLVRSRAAARVPCSHEPLSQQQTRARSPACSALVAVQQGKPPSTTTSLRRRRLDGSNNTRTTTTTTVARTQSRTRLVLRRAGAASSSSLFPGSAQLLLLLLSIALLSLTTPAGCVGSTTATAAPSPSPPLHDNLWDAINGDPDYSKLTACLEMADPSVADLLRAASGSASGQPLTLFAPKDDAFGQPAWRGGKGGKGGGGGGGKNTTIFDDR